MTMATTVTECRETLGATLAPFLEMEVATEFSTDLREKIADLMLVLSPNAKSLARCDVDALKRIIEALRVGPPR